MNRDYAANFDRDLDFTDLLGGLKVARLQILLSNLLAAPVYLLNVKGEALLEDQFDNNLPKVALRWQFDTVAWLSSKAPLEQVEAAAMLVEQLFLHSARYLMAADLHTETLQNNYDDLQQQHVALQQSETRYRELSEQLEQRVAEQVKTIETTQRNLFNAEKMAAIGQLAAGVAHEINNPLGFISSNLRTAQQYIEQLQQFGNNLATMTDNAQAKDGWAASELDEMLLDFPQLLRESTDGANRISAIIASLRTATEMQQLEESQHDINRIIRDSCGLVTGKPGETIKLVMQLDELPATRCYPNQLAQACLHLLLNAERACEVKINNINADKNKSKNKFNAEICICSSYANNNITVAINDNGCGISPESLSKVYDPFYTTCEVGQGTGLGLTMCRDIIQAHGGRIEINSQLDVGTTVEFILPVQA